VLDPDRWFIIIPDMFSGGLSSSASHDPGFPAVVTMADNVRAQYRLITEQFGVTSVAAAYGFSMGGGQAYHWAALYPELVQRAIVVCGSSKTSVHNRVFLSGLLRVLEAAPEGDHLAGSGHQRRSQRGPRGCARVDPGAGTVDAQHNRPVLPCR
jgi:homoserine O-acetyltransferase